LLGHHDEVTPADPLKGYVEAAVEGDAVALAELVRRTQDVVWRLCTVLGSVGEEEDLVQETYLRAFGSLGRYRGDAPVQVWLLSIARRVCADHVRRRQRQRRLLDRITAHTHEFSVPAHEVADDLLEVLDADRLEAFVLTQLVGLSYQDAATVIGCPIGTVRSRVSRARGDLLDATRRAQAR
jgi:RNA polymerase sigma-70 factor, ECF subfamily